MLLRFSVCLAILAFHASEARADLYKCVSEGGKGSYQADACPGVAQEKKMRAPSVETGTRGPGGVELLDVGQLARRIRQHSDRPSVVLLYGTHCPLSRRMFPEFVAIANQYRARGVEFLVFSTDNEEHFEEVPEFLMRHNAQFSPVAIVPWAPGSLSSAMAPLGIEVGQTWTRPLVAIRDRTGRVISQGQAVTDLSRLRATLDSLSR